MAAPFFMEEFKIKRFTIANKRSIIGNKRYLINAISFQIKKGDNYVFGFER